MCVCGGDDPWSQTWAVHALHRLVPVNLKEVPCAFASFISYLVRLEENGKRDNRRIYSIEEGVRIVDVLAR